MYIQYDIVHTRYIYIEIGYQDGISHIFKQVWMNSRAFLDDFGMNRDL